MTDKTDTDTHFFLTLTGMHVLWCRISISGYIPHRLIDISLKCAIVRAGGGQMLYSFFV